MGLLNYSTTIDAWQTVGEINQLLAKAGATHFSIMNKDGNPSGVTFTIELNKQPLNFALPCNVGGIIKHLEKPQNRKNLRGPQLNTAAQATRVGWRIIKDWIEAQTALVSIEMATITEVFLPYLIINSTGETLSQRMIKGDGMRLLK